MKNIEAAPIWDDAQASAVVPSNISDPVRIAAFASQLSAREKQQVATAYKAGSYEMATAFVVKCTPMAYRCRRPPCGRP